MQVREQNMELQIHSAEQRTEYTVMNTDSLAAAMFREEHLLCVATTSRVSCFFFHDTKAHNRFCDMLNYFLYILSHTY